MDNTGKHEKLSEGPVNDCTLRDVASFLVQSDAHAALTLMSGPQASTLTVSAGAPRARTVAVSHTRPQVPQLCSRSHNLDRLHLNASYEEANCLVNDFVNHIGIPYGKQRANVSKSSRR